MSLSAIEFEEIHRLLDAEARRYNAPDFIDRDPVQFPRHFSDRRDVEIASLLASTIAWGNRTMICRSAERMFGLMDWQPYAYVADEGYEDLPERENVHRTFFTDNLAYYLRGLHAIYGRYGSIEGLAASLRPAAGRWECASWLLAEAINRELAKANEGRTDCRCLPLGLDKSALKRFNMALRWLVRRDGIVDMGIWTAISPAELYIPLDVHVGNVSRGLGLTARRANDRRTVEEITSVLRRMRPEDPVFYDYALFGIGIDGGGDAVTRD